MGNHISKEHFDLEQYKLILEIDEQEKEIKKLKDDIIDKEKTIKTLQQFYNIPNPEIMTKDEYKNCYD